MTKGETVMQITKIVLGLAFFLFIFLELKGIIDYLTLIQADVHTIVFQCIKIK